MKLMITCEIHSIHHLASTHHARSLLWLTSDDFTWHREIPSGQSVIIYIHIAARQLVDPLLDTHLQQQSQQQSKHVTQINKCNLFLGKYERTVSLVLTPARSRQVM